MRRLNISSGVVFVRRQDREAAILAHALQEVVDFDVGLSIVAVLHVAALAEGRVCFVEAEDRLLIASPR